MAILVGLLYYVDFGYILKNYLQQVWLLKNSHLGVTVFKYTQKKLLFGF